MPNLLGNLSLPNLFGVKLPLPAHSWLAHLAVGDGADTTMVSRVDEVGPLGLKGRFLVFNLVSRIQIRTYSYFRFHQLRFN